MKNQIIQGDCLEVMEEISDKSIDMILCDLPYGTTACKWDTIIPFEPLWEQYKRIIKDNGAIVLTASQPFTSALVMSNPDMFRYEMIWEKSKVAGFLEAKNKPLVIHEVVLVFSKSKYSNGVKNKMNYFPQGLKSINKVLKPSLRGEKDKTGHNFQRPSTMNEYVQEKTNYPKSIIKITSESRTEHPTQKPVALFEYLIRTYTNAGDTVLDNCAGSGTTAIACLNTGRKYILIEKDKTYYDLILKRIAKHDPLFKEVKHDQLEIHDAGKEISSNEDQTAVK
jgi:site-specific DNA-methyltransferase (adenine-specific)